MEWKQWHGGECPVPEYEWVEVMELDSEIDQGFAGDFNWQDMGDWGGTIVAYRVPVLTEPHIKKLENVRV